MGNGQSAPTYHNVMNRLPSTTVVTGTTFTNNSGGSNNSQRGWGNGANNHGPLRNYADGLRPETMGTLPPATHLDASVERSKRLPDYFMGRDELERAREKLQYEREMAKYNRLNDAVPCSVACNHEFATCRRGCDSSILYSADLFEGQNGCAVGGSGGCARSIYETEAGTLKKQILKQQPSTQRTKRARNGWMADGAQQEVRGKNAVARRPVASVAIEESVGNSAAQNKPLNTFLANKNNNSANAALLVAANRNNGNKTNASIIGSINNHAMIQNNNSSRIASIVNNTSLLSPETNQARLVQIENHKRKELEANKLGEVF